MTIPLEPPPPAATLHATAESDIHIVDTHALPPCLSIRDMGAYPISDPATVNDSACDTAVLLSSRPDINTASYEPASDMLPALMPAVTATLVLCPSALRSPTLHVTDESDCHPVSSPAVCPHLTLAEESVIPMLTCVSSISRDLGA